MVEYLEFLEVGHASLIDVPPPEADDERKVGAWVIGYLFAYTQAPCPTALQVIYDATLGTVYEVTVTDDRKIGFVVLAAKGPRYVPVRIYER